MAKLKVLQLEAWMKCFDNPKSIRFDKYLLKYYQTRKPVIGRDGWYFQKGVSWFEKDGKAFFEIKERDGLVDSFKYSLRLMSCRSFRQVEIEIIQKALLHKVPVDKKVLDEYYAYMETRLIRNSWSNARRIRISMRKRMAK